MCRIDALSNLHFASTFEGVPLYQLVNCDHPPHMESAKHISIHSVVKAIRNCVAFPASSAFSTG